MQSAVKCLQSVAFSQKMIVRLWLHHFFLAGNSGVVGFFALLVCFLQTDVGLNCSEIKNNAQKIHYQKTQKPEISDIWGCKSWCCNSVSPYFIFPFQNKHV